MLVEDDNNLREIYEARLLAEGYEIVAAKDGEEALAMAVKEKPDLIIADVMMPKISGFDMLDILRSTAETKDTKVIVMTALSQAEDKIRADKLGADRYLVKSQVTLEDVAKTAREVLDGTPPNQAATPVADAPAQTPPPITPVTEPPAGPTQPASQPVTVPSDPVPSAIPVAEPPQDPTQTGDAAATAASLAEPASQEKVEVGEQIKDTGITPPKDMVQAPKSSELPVVHEKVIQPPTDIETKPDIHELLAKEEAGEQAGLPPANPPAETVIAAPSTDSSDDAASEPHTPGQIIGPNQTPGSDPENPHDISL